MTYSDLLMTCFATINQPTLSPCVVPLCSKLSLSVLFSYLELRLSDLYRFILYILLLSDGAKQEANSNTSIITMSSTCPHIRALVSVSTETYDKKENICIKVEMLLLHA